MDPKLPVRYPVSVEITDILSCQTYRLHNIYLFYDGKMAVHTSKLAKRIEMIIKPNRIDHSNPVMVLFISGTY